jgi:putative hydrolase of the HAD superfamily
VPDRLIVFDIGNVLLRFDTRRAARNFDRLDPGKGAAMAEALWSRPLMHRFETGKLSGAEVFSLLKKRFSLRMDFPAFRRAFSGIFDPIVENIALFRAFSGRRKVALLSNVNEIHWEHIHRRYPVLKRAHVPCGSHELGVMKPSPRAFRAVGERAGVPLRKMVYVDDREEFILAARRLGLTALHYTGRRKLSRLFAEAGVLP